MRVVRENGRGAAQLIILIAGLFSVRVMHAQALNMDGQSGIFFQPWAEVVPADHDKFNRPTVSFHIVNAGPVAGDYFNIAVEEGFGNWLEFGVVRSNHTDGGDPTISPLFNFAGMNIFNVKAKIVSSNLGGKKWVPTVSVGGVLRTNDPFIVQAIQHKNATNGDVYGVVTKLINIKNKFAVIGNAGVRGTNAQKYGYAGNTLNWQARAFGAISFPLPIRKVIVITPTFEIDQEPREVKFVPGATVPSDLIYAVRVSRLPDSRWSFDVGTGHVGANIAPGINVRANNAIAFVTDYRF